MSNQQSYCILLVVLLLFVAAVATVLSVYFLLVKDKGMITTIKILEFSLNETETE